MSTFVQDAARIECLSTTATYRDDFSAALSISINDTSKLLQATMLLAFTFVARNFAHDTATEAIDRQCSRALRSRRGLNCNRKFSCRRDSARRRSLRRSRSFHMRIIMSPRSHLTDEVRWRRVANQRVACGLWAAFLRGGGGVVQRLLPHGMT